ncbi:uncharacterized protein LOC142335098 isoform X2 [Convolutriloba macropyga]|uniref:uncharacterized protein LOC142335098 isoform X2 n=1 Tax=Convolutriloba macropyga TaxID=536237 RepID=UPI003F527D82
MKDPNSVHLLTCSETSVKLWSPPNYELSRELVPPHAATQISDICYDHVANRLISCNIAGQGIVATNLGDDESELVTPEINAVKLDLSFNCKYLLGGTLQGKITLLDLKSRKVKQTYSEHAAAISSVKISSRSQSIAASGDENGEIVSYNIASGKCNKLTSTSQDQNVQSVSVLNFSPFRNGILCSGNSTGMISFWDTSLCCETSFHDNLHHSPVTSLSFSPSNEMLLLTSSLDRKLVYLDTTNQQIVKTVHTEKHVTNTCLLTDGTTSAVATEDGLVLLYDLRKLDCPTFFFTSHYGAPVSHLSQLTAPPSFTSRRSFTGSGTSLNEVNGGKTSSGFSSSGFTSTSETESDVGNTTAELNTNRASASGPPLRVMNLKSPNGVAMNTPPIKRPLSSSNIGPNLVLPSYYGQGSVFSPLDSAHGGSNQELYSKSKVTNGVSSPVQPNRSTLPSDSSVRLPRTSSNDDSLTTVSEVVSVRRSSASNANSVAGVNKRPPQYTPLSANGLSSSVSVSVQTQTEPSGFFGIPNGDVAMNGMSHASTSAGMTSSSSQAISSPETVDLLRKTILESTESVKLILQKEFSNAQINSYNDFFTLKKMMERLTEENEAIKKEIAELRETVNKVNYRANFF